MAVRRALLVATALVAALAPAPASHADEPWIQLSFSPSLHDGRLGQPVGMSVCSALALPYHFTQTKPTPVEPTPWVPLAVRITCTFNGSESTATAAGPFAAAPVLLVTSPPYEVCATAEAVFVNPQQDAGDIRLVNVAGCTIVP